MVTKIMYLMDYYYDPRGGTEQQVLQLVQYMDKSRYEPSLTLLRSSEYIERHGFPCRVIALGISKIANIQAIIKLLRYGFELRRQGYRIVHCFFNDVSLIAPPVFRMFGIRVLVSRRDMGFWYTPRLLLALRVVSHFVDCYVVNSRAVKHIVQEREHVAEKKLSLIYNGYVHVARATDNAELTRRLGSVNGGPIVGIVANLRQVKRIDTLIRAFGAIDTRFPDARLVIVGDCQSEQAKNVLEGLKKLATDLGVRNRVIFTGSVDNAVPYINRFTVAVLCSESEGFSNALMEYMQAGRPIICTDTGGNPELVQDGTNGFLIPVGDVDALADRLVKVLSDSALARSLGKSARETVHSNYSHTRMIAEQMACYDKVLSGSRSDRQFKIASGMVQ